MKKHGFTLAETLITLTIIGVVAAMTIPTLMSKYQKHTYVVGLKKAYSQLKTAIQMVPITEGCSAGDYTCAGWENNDINQNLSLIAKNVKHKKYCKNGFAQEAGCEIYYKHFSDNMFNNDSHIIWARVLVLDDGSIWYSDYSTAFWVDVNGLQGPNKVGRDIFKFRITTTTKNDIQAYTLLPIGSKADAQYTEADFHYWAYFGKDGRCTNKTINEFDSTQGMAHAIFCAGRVLEEDAMNY